MARLASLGSILVSALVVGVGPAAAAHHRDREIGDRHRAAQLLSFKKMFGVDGAFVGDAHPVGGIAGDELPWEIAVADGRLDTAGNLVLFIRGLVFKDDPSVPEELRGINDETEFRAAVGCMTEKDGDVVQSHVITRGFPATRTGNSLMIAHVDLPDPCIAPAVFVLAGSEDKWFAVTGFETEEE